MLTRHARLAFLHEVADEEPQRADLSLLVIWSLINRCSLIPMPRPEKTSDSMRLMRAELKNNRAAKMIASAPPNLFVLTSPKGMTMG